MHSGSKLDTQYAAMPRGRWAQVCLVCGGACISSVCVLVGQTEVECSGDLLYTHSNHMPSLTEAVWLPCTTVSTKKKKKRDKCFPLPSQWSSLLQRIVFISESHYGLRIFLYIPCDSITTSSIFEVQTFPTLRSRFSLYFSCPDVESFHGEGSV